MIYRKSLKWKWISGNYSTNVFLVVFCCTSVQPASDAEGWWVTVPSSNPTKEIRCNFVTESWTLFASGRCPMTSMRCPQHPRVIAQPPPISLSSLQHITKVNSLKWKCCAKEYAFLNYLASWKVVTKSSNKRLFLRSCSVACWKDREKHDKAHLLLTNAFVCSSELLMSILWKIKQPVHTYCIANWTQQLVGKEFSNAQRTNCTKIEII